MNIAATFRSCLSVGRHRGKSLGGVEFTRTQQKQHTTDNDLPLVRRMVGTSSSSGTGGVPNSRRGGSQNYLEYGRSGGKRERGGGATIVA